MDTNGDGIVDVRDDPYTPYYPGDNYVDWVGMSVYWFGQQWPETLNLVPPSQRFVDVIRGRYATSLSAGVVYNFYDMFAEKHNKPFAIPESGAVFYSLPIQPGEGEVAIKEAWWRQVYNTTVFGQFPRLKLVSNFEENKVEDRGNVSYTLTLPPVEKQFLSELPWENLVWGDQFTYSCDGGFGIWVFFLLDRLTVCSLVF
jgi:hypothetical protein